MGALGGPAENPFAPYDSFCFAAGCTDPGQPQMLVNTSNLNLFVRVTDLVFGGPAPGLTLEHSYNSDAAAGGFAGNGWSFSLGESLTQATDSSWTLQRGSGRVDRFGPAIDPNQFFAITSTSDILTRNADGSFNLRNPQTNLVRAFDSTGRLTAITDSSGTRAQLKYAAGRLVNALPRGSSGRPIQFGYTGDGHLASITDQAGRTVGFAYDGSGNLVQQTNADGSTISYSYDGNGRLAAIANAAGQATISYGADPDFSGISAVSLADGSVRQYAPAGGRQVQVTDAAGNISTITSTVPGQAQSVQDPAGNVTSFTYDAGGHRTSTTTAAGSVIQFAYDGFGNLTSLTDPAQNRWTAAYTGNNLTQFTDANKNSWQFTYDAAGRLNSISDPYGEVTAVTRNAAGQITVRSNPNGDVSTFTYDADGLLAKWLDPLAHSWSYQYDGTLHVNSRTEPTGTTLQAAYDPLNRLQNVSSAAGSIAYDYSGLQRDALNRVIASTDSFGNQLAYTYTAGGRLASLAFPGGNAITWQYDSSGRLAQVTDWMGDFATYKYDPAGLLNSVNISAGPITVYQYGKDSNLSALISTGADGSVVAAYRYLPDANGNRVNVSGAEPSSKPVSVTAASLAYDAANHLTASSAGANYHYDSSGRLLSIDGGPTFSYDPGGRLTAAGGTQYTYDSLGLRSERDGTTSRRFIYDVSGERPRVVMETDASNNPVAFFVWGIGLLWKIVPGGQLYFYHYDGDGNVVAVSSPTSGIVNRYRYDPLGALIASDEAVENDFHAHGQSGWVDDGDGLLYTGAGYYSPALRATLPGKVNLEPPDPRILPGFLGAGACFLDGVANCDVAAGRREP